MISLRNLHPACIAALAFGLAVASSARAADVEHGKKIASEVCVACHLIDGNSTNPDYPKIAGQHADYIAKTLRDYQSGARNNAIMKGFATTLKEADIEAVAAWYSSQASPLSHRK